MANPLGLLGAGLKRTGGLLGSGLRAAGRNFDRNATGGLDALMGDEFTPDMRRNLRANAIMSMGQMLAGQGSLPQGLAQGQQRVAGAWQAGRERKREDEARSAMASLASQMGQDATAGAGPGVGTPQAAGGAPSAPAASLDPLVELQERAQSFEVRAKQYQGYAARAMALGKEKLASTYQDAASKAEDMARQYTLEAVKLRTPSGAPFRATKDGKPVWMQMSGGGTAAPVPGIEPEQDYETVNLGDRVLRVPKHSAGTGDLAVGITPDTTARLGQQRTQFEKMFPLDKQRADAATLGARASLAGAGAAQMNAATNAQRLAMAGSVMGQLGEGAKVTIAETQHGIRLLDNLRKAIDASPVGTGTLAQIATLPGMGIAKNLLGLGNVTLVNEPAVLKSKLALGKQVLAKAMEGGVLRKEDENKYDAMLPTIGDSPAVAKAKLNQFQQAIQEKLEIFVETQAKYGRGGNRTDAYLNSLGFQE